MIRSLDKFLVLKKRRKIEKKEKEEKKSINVFLFLFLYFFFSIFKGVKSPASGKENVRFLSSLDFKICWTSRPDVLSGRALRNVIRKAADFTYWPSYLLLPRHTTPFPMIVYFQLPALGKDHVDNIIWFNSF